MAFFIVSLSFKFYYMFKRPNNHSKSSSKNSKNAMQIRTVYSSENINIKSSSNSRKRSRDAPMMNSSSPSRHHNHHQLATSRATPNPTTTTTTTAATTPMNAAAGSKHSALAAAAYLASKFDGGSAGGSSGGGGGGTHKNKVKEIHVGAKEKSTKKFVDVDQSKRFYIQDEVVRRVRNYNNRR